MISKTIYRLLILVVIALSLSSCMSAKRVPGGFLATPDAKITAEDGSFEIISGQTFQTPFYTHSFFEVALHSAKLNHKDLVNYYERALASGAKKVTVKVPNRSQPLYGILAFVLLPSNASGPGARSYQLSIPDNYINAASGGRISVVYEVVNNDYISWILWLSDLPIIASDNNPPDQESGTKK